jgi:hypothetical protein
MRASFTPHAQQPLRSTVAPHHGQSPEHILESLLAEPVRRGAPKASLTVESFHAWLHQFTAYSDRIPSMPSETLFRKMVYQDQD